VQGTKGKAVQKPMADIAMEEPIGCKWVYWRKVNPDGSTRYNARLVIKGYEQKEDGNATRNQLVRSFQWIDRKRIERKCIDRKHINRNL
jgi:hypothetical protein